MTFGISSYWYEIWIFKYFQVFNIFQVWNCLIVWIDDRESPQAKASEGRGAAGDWEVQDGEGAAVQGLWEEGELWMHFFSQIRVSICSKILFCFTFFVLNIN